MTEELFEEGERYDSMLNQGLRLTGEDKFYFIRGRVEFLGARLPAEFRPRRILDFGCGVGDAAPILRQVFPGSQVVGLDVADGSLSEASRKHGSELVSFAHVRELESLPPFDLCYMNGALHHIDPAERVEVLGQIARRLAPSGVLAAFDNNPWNPATRLVMSRIPFDRDAQTLTHREARRLADAAGLRLLGHAAFLFYLPRSLAFMRPLERFLVRLPLGAQYCVIAQK